MTAGRTSTSQKRSKVANRSLTRLLVLLNIFVAMAGAYEATRFASAYRAATDAAKQVAKFPGPAMVSWKTAPVIPTAIAMDDQQADEITQDVKDLSTAHEHFRVARKIIEPTSSLYARGLIRMIRRDDLTTADRLVCVQELSATARHPDVSDEVSSLITELISEPALLPPVAILSLARSWIPDPSNHIRQRVDRFARDAQTQASQAPDSPPSAFYASKFYSLDLTPAKLPASELVVASKSASASNEEPLAADKLSPTPNSELIAKPSVDRLIAELEQPSTMQVALAKARNLAADAPQRQELIERAIAETRSSSTPPAVSTSQWVDFAAVEWRDRRVFDALLLQTTQTPAQAIDIRLVSRQMYLALADGDPRWVTGMLQSLPSVVPPAQLKTLSQQLPSDHWVNQMSTVIRYLTEQHPDLIGPWLNKDSLAGIVARRTLIGQSSWSPLIIERLSQWLNQSIDQEANRSQWLWLNDSLVDQPTRDTLTASVLAISDGQHRSRAWQWWLRIINANQDLDLATQALATCSNTHERRQAILYLLDELQADDWPAFLRVLSQAKLEMPVRTGMSQSNAQAAESARQIDAKLAVSLMTQKLSKGNDSFEVLKILGGPVTAAALESDLGQAASVSLQWPAEQRADLVAILNQRGLNAEF